MNKSYLKQYAKVLIHKGIGLQPGQTLCIDLPVDCADFAPVLCDAAYDAGAAEVEIAWSSPAVEALRLSRADDGIFDDCPDWQKTRYKERSGQKAAFLTIAAPYPQNYSPDMLKRLSRWKKAENIAKAPYQACRSARQCSWCIACAATPAWASLVFPDLAPEEAVDKLWEAIFVCTRADSPDPLAAWDAHSAVTIARFKILNEYSFREVIYRGPGTDLRVRLPKGAKWGGGAFPLKDYPVMTTPNIPTEEIAVTPSKYGTEGVVRSTRPLVYDGNVIEDFSIRFEKGRAVHWEAAKGKDVLDAIINADEGSCYLGEAALVEDGSLISRQNIVFYCTLFDENASCHLALGSGGKNKPENGDVNDPTNLQVINESSIHVDFMVGSGEVSVFGVRPGEEPVPILLKGAWVLKSREA